MPYFTDPNMDKDKEDEQNQLASGASEVKLAGGSSTYEAPSPSGSNQQQQSGTELKTGSNFQNLDKYLSTNQSHQFGQQVLGKVGNTIDTAKQNQAQASNEFQNQVNKSNYTPTESQVNESLSNPSQANARDFQKWMTQSYQGPRSVAENQSTYNKFWGGTNQAQTNAKQLGTEAGRFSLLDSYFGRPQYNFGEKSLDNLLVQQSGLGNQTRNLQNQATQLRSQGEQQAKNLQGFAANRAGEVNQSRTNVNQAFNQAQSQAQQSITDATAAANAQRAQQQSAMRQALSTGKLSDTQLASLGLSRGQNIYNLDANQYLNTGQALSNEQMATSEQRARLDALAQLAGQSQSFLGDQLQASPNYTFDTNRFRADASARQAAAANALNNRVPITALNGYGNDNTYTLQHLIDMKNNADKNLQSSPDSNAYKQAKDWYKWYGPEAVAAINKYNSDYGIGRTL